MSRIHVHIDGASIAAQLRAKFEVIVAPRSELFREVALELIPVIHQRIHVEGRAADGSQIGTYSNAYMKVRTGNYGNADTYKKGKNAGKPKNAGTATKGSSKGTARSKYNRNSETKVILSLTRQMENDYAVMPGEVGWGIGFNNSHNADKARWNDKRYGKTVYDLTEEELQYAVKRTEELLTAELNK